MFRLGILADGLVESQFGAGILACCVSLLSSTRSFVMALSVYFTGPLFDRMAEDLHLGGMSERTRAGYLVAVVAQQTVGSLAAGATLPGDFYSA
ncbi:MAG: hypothetical protein ABI619_02220 [Betaproteobacteria bacterium]